MCFCSSVVDLVTTTTTTRPPSWSVRDALPGRPDRWPPFGRFFFVLDGFFSLFRRAPSTSLDPSVASAAGPATITPASASVFSFFFGGGGHAVRLDPRWRRSVANAGCFQRVVYLYADDHAARFSLCLCLSLSFSISLSISLSVSLSVFYFDRLWSSKKRSRERRGFD